MNLPQHNQIVSFIWSIADDVLRDVYTRGKYRDIILPFTVLRRLDALLEPTKPAVLDMHQRLNDLKLDNQSAQLRKVSGYVFYNTSRFTLRSLLNSPGNIRQNLESYLDGFSSNVQEIISKFKVRNQFETLEDANITYPLIEKFCSTLINLSPEPVLNKDGQIVLPGLTNLGMGYVFEELIRKFNEENNEEAGEHFTPREIIRLMTHLIFEPIQKQIQDVPYLVYDPACGSGGMLTESEHFAKLLNPDATFHLYGQEINPETYAICKADMLIKGEDPERIAFGSTLSHDGFPQFTFDFMLSNPPYGKTWKTEQDGIIDKKTKEISDHRFSVGVPRVNDGQLLFLCNMLSKIKTDTPLGSRIATVHNGSALFTGDAGSGESEIRKWIIENDWLECIIQLPNNMFYNTGISTYIWVVTNRKPAHRQGKVQLIDASGIYQKMRKSLGSKNCELSNDQIQQLTDVYLNFAESDISRIFDNAEFGYWQITVDRPLRLRFQLSQAIFDTLEAPLQAKTRGLYNALRNLLGQTEHKNYNLIAGTFNDVLKTLKLKLTAKEKQAFMSPFMERDETAEPVYKDPSDPTCTEFEPDSQLRDTENVPLTDDIQAYFDREVLPYVPNA